ncbi:hypothetical protein AA0117_g8168 [Alternaria alternata]|jgi:hypothetical protein|uniref:Heterokaryon incompatibility domain-containing protein n=1 Tax=Alternaria alternata TaxID=5599 RepID=A0A4Q4NCA2_ALTAL|nr:hypothetical protein AA0117_g8168 [Alternaria alternata]
MAGSSAAFVHEPINQAIQEIRLISIIPETTGPIRCNLTHVNLQSNPTPEYRALSYVWGPPSPVQEIQVNGHRFLVRQNLYDFIYAFRERLYKFRGGNGYEDEVQWLWIDQICINQALIGERNHQVKMMSDIYRRATYVYVWLGKPNGSTEATMKVLKCNYRRYHDSETLTKSSKTSSKISGYGTSIRAEDSISLPALRHFFGNPYWLRLWIVQEIMLARYIRVMCGETLLSWDELKRFCSSTLPNVYSDDVVPLQLKWLTDHALSARHYSYAELLLTFSASQCENPQDRVFGLQGLIPDAERAEIDYGKPANQIFCETARAFVDSANSMPQAPFNRSLEHLSYSGAKETFFSDATMILMQETEYDLRLHLVNVLMTLGDNMGMSCSERPDAKKMVLALEAIRAMWQEVASYCERMSSDDFVFLYNMQREARAPAAPAPAAPAPAAPPNPSGYVLIMKLLDLENMMNRLYDNLRSIVKEFVSNMLYGTEVGTHA